VKVRAAVPGDGAAIARVHRDGAGYYVGLAPELFRLPDDDGLIEFVDPKSADNSPTMLFIVTEIDLAARRRDSPRRERGSMGP
jgi:hypothetical protein